MDKITVEELYSAVNDGHIISDISLQRAIVYDAAKQAMVIDSLVNGVPLPAIYLWRNENGVLEVLDGKQRIESICKFMKNELEYDGTIWREWGQKDPGFQAKLKGCKLTIIECSGTDELKRKIFNRINTLGVALSKFEVLNGLYHGLYLEELGDHYNNDATYRSILKAEAMDRGGNKYVILQYIYYLRNNRRKPSESELTDYVAERAQTSIGDDIRLVKPYFRFIKDIFGADSPVKRDWLFRIAAENRDCRAQWLQHKDSIQRELKKYIKSQSYKDSLTKYEDILAIINAVTNSITLDPKRLFSQEDKERLAEEQGAEDGKYRCRGCNQLFTLEELTVDHITPWSLGGRTVLSNGQLMCRVCNSRKNNRN